MKLESASPVDSKLFPFVHSWDTSVRESFTFHQELINRIAYHLQRAQRGYFFFGEWNYPQFYQKDHLMMDLYQKKQMLGKINQDEMDKFKKVNPKITNAYKRTFNTQLLIPYTGKFLI